jgi:hypothetical protein
MKILGAERAAMDPAQKNIVSSLYHNGSHAKGHRLQVKKYEPEPIATAGVQLSTEILELTERLAKNAHDIWARQRMADGWSHGLRRGQRAPLPGTV